MKKTWNILFFVAYMSFTAQANAKGDCTFSTSPIKEGHIALQRVASGLTQPVAVFFAPSQTDRMYIIEKPGRIVASRSGSPLGIVLDIRSRVSLDNPETGLLGATIHPKFPQDRRLFVNYVTRTQPLRTRISSFTIGMNGAADPNSERIIMEFVQPYNNHNGGDVKFGPDGMLYIAVGDGGDAGDPHGHGQNLATIYGTILRIDINSPSRLGPYSIPKDNPFIQTPGARGEIWAYGLRNPWRFSFDRQTGTMWAGDVGQDSLEEINVIKKSGNYGWSIMEGHNCFKNPNCNKQGLTSPIWQYGRDQGISVTGGYVYRGRNIRGLQGTYVYADFYSGKIWGLRVNSANRQVQNTLLLHGTLFTSSFGEDQSGELYIADHQSGEIYKLVEKQVFGRGLEKSMIPQTLSETGCFKSMSPLIPNDNLAKYHVNSPLWSDYAIKDRFIAVPRGKKMGYSAEDRWEIPQGSTLVKNFSLDLVTAQGVKRQVVETRILVKAEQSYLGFTYAWNKEGTEAYLLERGQKVEFEVQTPEGPQKLPYLYPARGQCVACHSSKGFGTAAVNTLQLNMNLVGQDGSSINQIHQLVRSGHLDARGVPKDLTHAVKIVSPYDLSKPVDQRARAYLHSNCGHCHNRVGGFGRGSFDLRYELSLAQTNLCNAKSLTGDLGIPDAGIVKAGNPDKSLLYLRTITLSRYRMPPMGSYINDVRGHAALKEWISHLDCSAR